MPYASMEAAKKSGAKTMLDDCPLSLAQINKMAEMADAMKAEGKVDNPWAVVIANFQKSHHKENGKWVSNKESFMPKYNIHETLSLSEGQIIPDGEGGKKSFKAWWPLLKAGPGNVKMKNYYSPKALESLTPRIPHRNKMFVSHAEGDVKPIERDPRDWVGSIRESKIENGILYGLVQAVDPWLKEKMYDCPQDLAASIEGRGKASGIIKHEGEDWNLIEEVKWLNGFMVVDYPGNAPMGVQLTEADTDEETAGKEDKMESLAEFKEKFPAIYEEAVKEVKEADKAEYSKIISEKDSEIKKLKDTTTMDQKTITDLSESVKKMDAKLDGMEALTKKKDRDQKVATEMAKLPAEAITEKFKSLVEGAKDEATALDMVADRAKLFEGKVLGHGKSQERSPEESLKEREAAFMGAYGIKPKEEKKEDRK